MMISSPEPLSSPGAGLTESPTNHPCAKVIADAEGVVVACDDVATVLLTGLTTGTLLRDVAPDWLVRAHERIASAEPALRAHLLETVQGSVGDQQVDAIPSLSGSDAVTWWLVDHRDLRLVRAQLDEERDRSRLLQDIFTELLASLNIERCMEVTARMTADHLADVAVVVGVGSGRSHPVTWAVRGGPVRRRLISIDAGTARPRGGVGRIPAGALPLDRPRLRT